MPLAAVQLDLFIDLPLHRLERAARRPAPGRLAAAVWIQLCLELPAVASNDDDGDEDPLVREPIVHRLVSASEAAPLALRGPRSVFDMAGLSLVMAKRRTSERTGVITRVERLDGVVRCVRILPQETQEWQAREAARRARQVTPKPTRKAKTMSSKMMALLGGEPMSECYAERMPSVALTPEGKATGSTKQVQRSAEKEQAGRAKQRKLPSPRRDE